jgi:hypothetical protein
MEAMARGPCSAKDISTEVGIGEKEVFEHLSHIQKSLHGENLSLHMVPARCRSCGFEFQKRQRFSKPGRCPICRNSFIEEPRFEIS